MKEIIIDLAMLQRFILKIDGKTTTEYGSQFLKYGVGRRLETISFILKKISCIYPENKYDLLSQEQIPEFILLLNAFYLNLSGCLDNISWVIAYEGHFITDINSNSEEFPHSKKVSIDILKNQKDALGGILEEIFSMKYSEFYEKYYEKIKDLQNKRHISAHRIHFYISNIVTKEEREKLKQAEAKIWENNLSEFPPEMQDNLEDPPEVSFQKTNARSAFHEEIMRENEKIKAYKDKLGRPSPYFIGEFTQKKEDQFLIYPTINDDCTLVCDFLKDSLAFISS